MEKKAKTPLLQKLSLIMASLGVTIIVATLIQFRGVGPGETEVLDALSRTLSLGAMVFICGIVSFLIGKRGNTKPLPSWKRK